MGIVDTIKTMLHNIETFTTTGAGITMRAYQIPVARAIIDSVIHHRGLTFVVQFPRQSGKNEVQAIIETYLLLLFSNLDGEIVKAAPTWHPQCLTAMRRIDKHLQRNILTRGRWVAEQGYIRRVGTSRIYFLSGSPSANTVSHTASVLLEIDEAQDVQPNVYDRTFFPMTASTHATKVFWGTPWDSRSLLARELRAARAAEAADGIKRAFTLNADDVAAVLPAYRATVAEQIQKLGRNHPLVKTQFFCEEIDSEAGLFPPARIAMMRGAHSQQTEPTAGHIYALLIDVAGEDETGGEDLATMAQPARDATAATVVEIDSGSVPTLGFPTYRVVQRRSWIGRKHTVLYPVLVALAKHWQARQVITDATGVGAGIASFLSAALPGRVIPFIVTSKSKSDLAFAFLAVCDTGRYQDYTPTDPLAVTFWQQAEYCQYQARENRMLSWAVPDGTRDENGELIHDDLLFSAALCSQLDVFTWGRGEAEIIQAVSPLADLRSTW